MVLALLTGLSPAADVDNGALLAGLGGCASCHTSEEGEPYAGGHAIETRFGTFYGTNLTPDPTTGLGAWSERDFVKAMRRGKGPDGPYYPAFPYPSFTGMTDTDLADLWAFLRRLDPVVATTPEHELEDRYSGGLKLRLWRLVAFSPSRFRPPPRATSEEARGAYLVEVVGHCGECHTPRGRLGKLKRGEALTGHDAKPYPSPDITPAALDWDLDDWLSLLQDGMEPDGDFVGRGMRAVVEHGTAKLDEDDQRAIAAWCMALR